MSFEDRDLRQRGIIPPERLKLARVTIVGVGAIGRQVALQLAAIGVPWIQIIDFDTVDVVNLAPQGFLESDLGRPKVEAVAEMMHKINTNIAVFEHNERFKRSMEIGTTLFCCVDKIDTRKLIWEAVCKSIQFFVDARMSAEVIRILTGSGDGGREHYPKTLFTAEEAHVGACTAKSTVYTASIAAGLMISQFTQWLRNMPLTPDMTLNLLAGELNVTM